MTATQIAHEFHYDLDGIGSVEVRATWFLGEITLNSVRRNSDYKSVALTPAQRRDLACVAGWYIQDVAG